MGRIKKGVDNTFLISKLSRGSVFSVGGSNSLRTELTMPLARSRSSSSWASLASLYFFIRSSFDVEFLVLLFTNFIKFQGFVFAGDPALDLPKSKSLLDRHCWGRRDTMSEATLQSVLLSCLVGVFLFD